MTSAIEVVGEIQSEAAAEVALDAEVRLLRVRVNEILRLRIAKGLEAQRQESRRVQIVLVEKNRLREVQSLKLLLVGKISECGGSGWVQGGRARIRRARTLIGSPWKIVNRVQIAGIARSRAESDVPAKASWPLDEPSEASPRK